ncbi:restriction endonuclease [Humibacter albus]|uniref:restriction endonuclease n=1 Tax=Humibacter albus TaxID=427754 RepID=UPI0003FD656A|nr:restriction endonuclease [Humibacter albus]
MSETPEDGVVGATAHGFTVIQQRARWLAQAATPPNLQCGKEEMVPRTVELLEAIFSAGAVDLSAQPTIQGTESTLTWRQYSYALRGMGVVESRRGTLALTPHGEEFLADKSPSLLATLMAARVRLFAEALALVADRPLTVEEINSDLVRDYNLGWATLSSTRQRLTWLEVLGLVEWLGDRKLTATQAGHEILRTWELVTPAAVVLQDAAEEVNLPNAPAEIAMLLEELGGSTAAQDSRNTYNIWVPSPASDPNKIENMRISISAAVDPIDKEELLAFIANRFGLKRSSVESMMPFMRAGGFLQEVRRGVFVATPAAKAWLRSGVDVDFIRILHVHMRYVGELIRTAHENVARSEVYREGSRYGLNKEKIRWLIAFMVDAGLLIDTSWSSVQATAAGRSLVEQLPLADVSDTSAIGLHRPSAPDRPESSTLSREGESRSTQIAEQLVRTASDPGADERGSGVAFEMSIESAFKLLGFRAQRISGSGDTDVLIQWYDHNQQLRTAIVEAKSTSSGQIAHTNVSDVAISAHKEKHAADFVAIVAPSFSGDTIKEMAAKKNWALVTASELGEIVGAAESLGLRPADVGALFETPDGPSRVAHLIDSRQRQMDMVSLVVSRLRDEGDNEEAVSPRDISLIERRSELAPSIDELISTFGLLISLDMDIARIIDANQDPKHETYQIGDVRSAANRLRALATALERGMTPITT